MAINIKNQIFTLHTKNSTYQMKVDEQNMLIHTYYGNRTDDTDCSYLIRMADRGFSGNIPGTDRERVYSLDFLPQEFPVYGDGDYRVDCLKADLGSGVQDGMFFFDSYQVREGKYNISGLPAFFSSEKSEGETLEIVLKDACSVPMEIMEKCCEAIDLIVEFAAKGSKLAISDAGVGAAFCKAALQGASLNVYINTKSMANREYAEELNKKADAMLEKYTKIADETFESVLGRLK